jgi:endonuclease III
MCGRIVSPKYKIRQMKSYSQELGLDLKRPEDRQEWFLASVLFAKRISWSIALRTFKRFQEEKLTTPQAILEAGWGRLVQVLDSGGYVRYDFSTASTLLDISRALLQRYGDLERIHARAKSAKDLEELLMEFKGVGPVAVNIFLRELRGIWEKADPGPSRYAMEVADRLKIGNVQDVESQLVRINLEYCKRGACEACPVNESCIKNNMASNLSKKKEGGDE